MAVLVRHGITHRTVRLPIWYSTSDRSSRGPCLQGDAPTRTAGSSIYPAVQNMLLAARALGLGATLTTRYLSFEKEAEAALGLLTDWHSYAILPIGYPMGRFGPVRRVAIADVVFKDQWGQAYRDRSGGKLGAVTAV